MAFPKQKIGPLILLLLIIGGGIFLRAYNFENWLHFELDQSRDAKVVGLALEHGIGNLPLLGPKAAGSFLRLGPIFYYYEYLSGLIFGNDPSGIAMLSLVFSCLTPIIFYFFVRRYFDQKISIILTAISSFSFFLIMYSRFAWNPNNLPFFILLFFYAILKCSDHFEARKGWWLLLAAVAFSVATQLHFVAFLSLPIVAAIYLIIKRPNISFKFWLAAVLIVVFFYAPNIVNDIKTGGDNISEFQKVFLKKSTKDKEEHTLVEKTIKSAEEVSVGYFTVYTGYQNAELPRVRMLEGGQFDIVCDNECRKNMPVGILAAAILILGIVYLGLAFFSKKEMHQKDFLILVSIWLFISLGLFVPIAYDLAPRFFLLIAPLGIILIGMIFDFLDKIRLTVAVYFLAAALLASNGYSIYVRFSELARTPKENFKIETDKILKERDRVTLEQQLKITDYIEKIYLQNKFPVYANSEAFYRRSFLYHLDQRGIPQDDFRNAQRVYANGNFFLIYPTSEADEILIYKYQDRYDLVSVENFGTMKVLRLVPKPGAINAIEQTFGPEKKPTSAPGVPVRCRWNEVFGKCNTDSLEDDENN